MLHFKGKNTWRFSNKCSANTTEIKQKKSCVWLEFTDVIVSEIICIVKIHVPALTIQSSLLQNNDKKQIQGRRKVDIALSYMWVYKK